MSAEPWGACGLLDTHDFAYAYRQTHLLQANGTRGRVRIEVTAHRYSFQPAGSETATVWEAGCLHDRDCGFHRTFDRHRNTVVQA